MSSDYLLLRRENLNCEAHINPELEIIYVENGEMCVLYEGGKTLVKPGEAVMIMPYHLHGFICSENTKATVFMFSYSVAQEFHKEYKAKSLTGGKFRLDREFENYLFYMLKAFDFNTDKCTIKSLFYSFLAQFLRNNQIEQREKLSNLPLQEIVEYVFFHLSEDLSLQKVSREKGINKNTLSSLFRDSMKITFGDFVNNVRIERAKFLLLKSDYNVTEIAYECGFGSVRTLNRVFFKKTNLTPTDYRNNFL